MNTYSLFICQSIGPRGTSWPFLPDAEVVPVKSVAFFVSAELTEEMAGSEQEAGASLDLSKSNCAVEGAGFKGTTEYRLLPESASGVSWIESEPV